MKFDTLGSYFSFYVLNDSYDAAGGFPSNQIYSKIYGMTVKLT